MTTFPDSIQTFKTYADIDANDAALVKQYQEAIQQGKTTTAATILAQISNARNKIITANDINTIVDTLYAVEQYFVDRYSSTYVVQAEQPTGQRSGDLWFKIIT